MLFSEKAKNNTEGKFPALISFFNVYHPNNNDFYTGIERFYPECP